MGDWGVQPWDNDEAADWFHRFWTKGFSVLIDEIRNFDAKEEGYDSFRAASYVLQTMGNPYIWPSEHHAVLKELLDKSISVLQSMIDSAQRGLGLPGHVGSRSQSHRIGS